MPSCASRCAGQRRVPPPVQLAARVTSSAAVKSRYSGVSWATKPMSARPSVSRTASAEHPHRARVGLQQPDGQVQQRALARAVRPDQRGDPAGRQLQRAVPQRPGAAVPLAEPVGLQDHVHPLSSRSAHAGSFCGASSARVARMRRLHQGDDVLGREAGGLRPVQPGDQVVAQLGLVGQGRAGQGALDERAHPGSAADQTLDLQLPVRLQHRVRVDRQGLRDVPDLRQLVARRQQADPQRLFHLLHELHVGVHLRPAVQHELDHSR